jgi:hypothetical protein
MQTTLLIYGGALLMGVAGFGPLVLLADSILRRRIWRAIKGTGRGSRITVEEHRDSAGSTRSTYVASIDAGWWWAVLPWWGKAKWKAEILTKIILLGVKVEYVAVAELDWDEAYVITVDEQNKICSTNELACSWAYLKHIGVEQ